MSTTGTGKSYLIPAIKRRLRRIASIADIESKSPVLIIALMGVAAFNINESIIHSTLSIPILNNKSIDINSERTKQLQERLENEIYFIIDEMSMVGQRMLALVD
ncbi:hypothetical protein RclHR1_15480004 [Rhizophagus clarus]|uniref:ATP-dependent DNA helicase n=1 Tax=Rhizophagus clarus TaxID=94130 RepID=A0A2Z6QGX6_9GLOM|nr:hypothetical protein RclHR1_15480004 [Rhizophagus clarus]GES89426.1 ATP-dependent DNA helicase Pif1-like [Rhizophagus clarus]